MCARGPASARSPSFLGETGITSQKCLPSAPSGDAEVTTPGSCPLEPSAQRGHKQEELSVWIAPLLGASWTQEGDPHGRWGGEWEPRGEEELGLGLEG